MNNKNNGHSLLVPALVAGGVGPMRKAVDKTVVTDVIAVVVQCVVQRDPDDACQHDDNASRHEKDDFLLLHVSLVTKFILLRNLA